MTHRHTVYKLQFSSNVALGLCGAVLKAELFRLPWKNAGSYTWVFTVYDIIFI